MDNQVITTIISTGGAVIVGLGGMWIASNNIGKQIAEQGKRIDDLGKRLDDMGRRIDRLEDRFNSFYEMVMSKFNELDLEISKLMDKK